MNERYEKAVVDALKEFNDTPVRLSMDVGAIFSLISVIQLACRHPNFYGPTRQWAESFARDLQEHIAEISPELDHACELGWRPEFDVPRDPSRKCRVCGCTEAHACPGGCHWVEENLCSACEPVVRSLIVP